MRPSHAERLKAIWGHCCWAGPIHDWSFDERSPVVNKHLTHTGTQAQNRPLKSSRVPLEKMWVRQLASQPQHLAPLVVKQTFHLPSITPGCYATVAGRKKKETEEGGDSLCEPMLTSCWVQSSVPSLPLPSVYISTQPPWGWLRWIRNHQDQMLHILMQGLS